MRVLGLCGSLRLRPATLEVLFPCAVPTPPPRVSISYVLPGIQALGETALLHALLPKRSNPAVPVPRTIPYSDSQIHPHRSPVKPRPSLYTSQATSYTPSLLLNTDYLIHPHSLLLNTDYLIHPHSLLLKHRLPHTPPVSC